MNELLNLSTTDIVAQAMQPGALGDAANDYAEVGLDQLTDMIFAGTIPNVLRELPVVKTIVALGRTGTNIYNAFRLKKQLVFLQTVNAGNPDPREITKREKAAKENKKWFRREIEQIAIYLERHTHEEKAKMQALIYLDYISGSLSLNRYTEYLDILDQLFLCDIPQIVEYLQMEWDQDHATVSKTTIDGPDGKPFVVSLSCYGMVTEGTKIARLLAVGLLTEKSRVQKKDKDYVEYELSAQGRYFANMAKSLKYDTLSEEYRRNNY